MRVEEGRPLLSAAAINAVPEDGQSGKAVGGRLTSIDLLRGVIVIVMVRKPGPDGSARDVYRERWTKRTQRGR